ncbi:MAG: hypothetical protein J6C58_05910, partial [Bacteroidaceae bacterium]|nr:hypothetical protein [Bacteroidaceae bacterium]
YDTMRELIACPDKETLIEAVNKLTEEDAKLSLVMTILCWKQGNKMNEEIDKSLRKRIAELENK